MSLVRRLVLCLKTSFVLSFFFLVAPSAVGAAGEFTTVYEATYEIQSDASCAVRQRITLTNKTREFYASEHTLNLGRSTVKNLWARDAEGPLASIIIKNGEDTVIKTVFKRPVAGEGKSLTWDLGYKTDDCKLWGNTLRLDIPGIEKDSEIASYLLKIQVPKTFGELSFVSPEPDRRSEEDDLWVLEFDKEKLSRGGIRAGFGGPQVFDLKLKYYLKNPESNRAYLEIALPPDIPGRQQILFESLTPEPEAIRIDDDGNYLAKFLLAPKEEKEVVFSGKSVIRGSLPVGSALTGSATTSTRGDLPQDVVERYTLGDKYWETADGQIKERVQALTRPGNSVFENARSIYEYVVAHLTYDKNRLATGSERLGASAALKQREQALCTEYADLFITLCRAAGIPARGLEGYAYTEDATFQTSAKDVLHSWAEIYLPGSPPSHETSGGTPPLNGSQGPSEAHQSGGWWPVDPTWGSTTGGSDYFSAFDLSHIVFVIKGEDSEAPYPAGTYKWDEKQQDLIGVTFGALDNLPEVPSAKLQVALAAPGRSLAGWPVAVRLAVKNAGSQSAFQTKVKLLVRGAALKSPAELNLGTIPPWSEKEVTFSLNSPAFSARVANLELGLEHQDFSGNVTGEVIKRTLKFDPFWDYLLSRWLLLPLGIVSLLLGGWRLRNRLQFKLPRRFRRRK